MVNSARHTSKAAMRARAQEELIKGVCAIYTAG